ncbi:MFS transporter [Clostridium swellfunianum]|uniref:MFS transporter n=1 Tax=Clostridium swellfunianum TaxID=1367462 RepID=UPI00202E9F4D|nr:MFS transporter [Clostridium swellfunianum]MCM0649101.1 MFS transporter [Clostridium swellfunianum]
MKISYEASNLLLYSLGKFVSIFGTTIFTFAIGLYVLKLTGSGLSFAAVLIMSIIPKITIYPFAGVLADKLDKKTMVVMMDLLNGVMFVGLYLLSPSSGLSLSMVFGTTLIMNIFTCFFDISFEAAIPNIVSEKMLMNINSASRVINSLSSILGPIIGGMIYAFLDVRFFILINGLSFLLSGISELFIDFKFNFKTEGDKKAGGKINFIKDIKEGFDYLIQNKNLKGLLGVFAAFNFIMGFSVTVPLPFIINNILKLNSRDFGIIQGAIPGGMIIGALIVKKISERISYIRILKIIGSILTICIAMIGLPTIFDISSFSNLSCLIYYCIIMGIFGVAISIVDIPLSYIMQKSIPDEYRGRVISMLISLVKIIAPVALLASGFLINLVPAYFMTSLGGLLLMAFISIYSRISRQL